MMIVKCVRILKYGSIVVAIFLLLFFYFYDKNNDDASVKNVFNAGGYENSQTLQEKLKPKLDKKFLENIGKNENSGSIIWDDIGAAHNAQDVQIRDEGRTLISFQKICLGEISVKKDFKIFFRTLRVIAKGCQSDFKLNAFS